MTEWKLCVNRSVLYIPSVLGLGLSSLDVSDLMALYYQYCKYLTKHSHECLSRNIIFKLPYLLLREHYSGAWMRAHGTYFTDDAVSDSLLRGVSDFNGSVYDPAAGCGDLILRYLEHMPLQGSFDQQIRTVSRRIFACEIDASFVCLMRLRIWLYLFLRNYGHVKISDIKLPSAACLGRIFPGIVVGDGLKSSALRTPDLVLMNPPFQKVCVGDQCAWASGHVSLAAVFLASILKRFPDSRLLAILPDVIRSGTRYSRLRSLVGLADYAWSIVGRFDSKTDVDVFTVDFGRKAKPPSTALDVLTARHPVSSFFEVHVGSVVLFRDDNVGQDRQFLCAESVPAGRVIRTVGRRLKNSHAPVKGPIVVVRRTSSPSDRIRCVSSFIDSTSEFHVDNHLIWLKPKLDKDARLACRQLHSYFQSEECTDLVNDLIRCRHLTVRVVASLPYKETK